MSDCGFRGTVPMRSAVPLYSLCAKGAKYIEVFLSCLNNVKKIAHGLNYSLTDREGITTF